ncbi:hypothetical protein PROSTU_00170 [Providencia stuartii ATCC 25827]|uniref:Uncharacterized protein n=1 Tax=Providencia stuartii ATCC 25827 TaxID=471874 RepID=A0AA87CTB8_PROST|nr:hypothetical protein PROSTU_00170 [Providencia stuartii ATCC 25827]
MSEWGNPVQFVALSFDESIVKRGEPGGTETSQYPEERNHPRFPTTANERGTAPNFIHHHHQRTGWKGRHKGGSPRFQRGGVVNSRKGGTLLSCLKMGGHPPGYYP